MQAKNVPCGMDDPRDLLISFRRYLGLTHEKMALLYNLRLRTLLRWEQDSQSGGPDMKNHPRLLHDLYKWYFNRWYFDNKTKEIQVNSYTPL
jgi:hypothetical protein